ncbi:hypothetical protein H0H93_012237 [Arthromyces matolae]|nr:hypothetical protein H0H93_012237 [Arthromyces matolae]
MPQKKKRTKAGKKGTGDVGRRSDFKGSKLAFLVEHEDEFLEAFEASSNDAGKFYEKMARNFLLRWGTDTPITEDSEPIYTPSSNAEVLQWELPDGYEISSKKFKALKRKLGGFFRHRTRTSSEPNAILMEILESMEKASTAKPRKRSAVSLYSKRYYATKIRDKFNEHWQKFQGNVPDQMRINMCSTYINMMWEKEAPEFREALEEEVEKTYQDELKEYQRNNSHIPITAKDYHESLSSAGKYLIPLANAISDRVGMSVSILLCGPDYTGEVVMQSAHSVAEWGRTSKSWPEWDNAGFRQVESSMIGYGRKLFSQLDDSPFLVAKEECLARKYNEDINMDDLHIMGGSEEPEAVSEGKKTKNADKAKSIDEMDELMTNTPEIDREMRDLLTKMDPSLLTPAELAQLKRLNSESATTSKESSPSTSNNVPPSSTPSNNVPPSAIPPNQVPPSSTPSDTAPPSSIPPDQVPPSSTPSDTAPPSSIPPDQVPPSSTPSDTAPPSSTPLDQVPPSSTPSNNVPPSSTPPNTAPTSSTPPNQVPLSSTPSDTVPPSLTPSNQVPPSSTPSDNLNKTPPSFQARRADLPQPEGQIAPSRQKPLNTSAFAISNFNFEGAIGTGNTVLEPFRYDLTSLIPVENHGMKTALTYLSDKTWGLEWRECIEGLVEFEQALGFPRDGGRIPGNSRPTVFSNWMRGGRRGYEVVVDDSFASQWGEWWKALRGEGVEVSQLGKAGAKRLGKGGANGMLLVVLGLAWWANHIDDASRADKGVGGWEASVKDVKAALKSLTVLIELREDDEEEEEEEGKEVAADAGSKRKSASDRAAQPKKKFDHLPYPIDH